MAASSSQPWIVSTPATCRPLGNESRQVITFRPRRQSCTDGTELRMVPMYYLWTA